MTACSRTGCICRPAALCRPLCRLLGPLRLPEGTGLRSVLAERGLFRPLAALTEGILYRPLRILAALSERILCRALCVLERTLHGALRVLCVLYRALRGLLGVLESALRRPLFALPDRTRSESFTLFLDALACADDSLFSCIRLVLLVHGSLSFSLIFFALNYV